ncbi:MAG TPA: glycosyltransferase [Polyangia bacterium]|jgi:beta-1,4-mannosyltransferase
MTTAAPGARPRVAVVVLGDLGRSPRMQYHALALANEGCDVDLIGYGGRPVDDEVAVHPRIRVHLLATPWRQRAPRWLFVPVATGDVAAQALSLAFLLLVTLPRPDVLLTQNPPTFPTVAVARLVALVGATSWVIDWHNFGADMLALRFGRGHVAVRAARAVERILGRGATAHLCVSEAMRETLATAWGIAPAHVLRDRPSKRVGRTPLAARPSLFERNGILVDPLAPDRPAVIITSSSWTPDEDFSMLLEAMRFCDDAIARGTSVPPLLFVMTGEGKLRAHWEARIAALALAHVRTRTLWVSAADYPLLLGAADLGVSLHRSASGVDLPMKIADMFGAGLPVCAFAYGPVVAELVRERENGLLFSTGPELGAQICEVLGGFPGPTPLLEELRRGVERLAGESWADGWQREARPVFFDGKR